MSGSVLRLGIAGCGSAARVHLERILMLSDARVVGCADPDATAAKTVAERAASHSSESVPSFADHRELLRETRPDVLAVFTPHLAHYWPAMDALQAGCHVFVEKPLSTNLQEAVDLVALARSRDRKLGVGHQYRLSPSFQEARSRIAEGAIGKLRLVNATLARPWLAAQMGAENSWRFDPKSAGGILADVGDHLLDTLLWTTGQPAVEVAALQARLEPGLDVVSAASVRLGDGTLATMAVSGITPGSTFELTFYGESGWIRASDRAFTIESPGQTGGVTLSDPTETIDGNFIAAVLSDRPLCCPADQALDTVRLLEAIGRSAATGQIVKVQ